MNPLNTNFDQLCFNGQRHASFSADFQAKSNRFANVGQGFVPRASLTDTTGNGRALGDPNAIFIPIKRGPEFHQSQVSS
jgi:hypothetical protein